MAKPTFNAYSVREYEKDGKKDSFWTKKRPQEPESDALQSPGGKAGVMGIQAQIMLY